MDELFDVLGRLGASVNQRLAILSSEGGGVVRDGENGFLFAVL